MVNGYLYLALIRLMISEKKKCFTNGRMTDARATALGLLSDRVKQNKKKKKKMQAAFLFLDLNFGSYFQIL